MTRVALRPEIRDLIALGPLPSEPAPDRYDEYGPRLEAIMNLDWTAEEELALLNILPLVGGDDYSAWVFAIIEKYETSLHWPHTLIGGIPADTAHAWAALLRHLALNAIQGQNGG